MKNKTVTLPLILVFATLLISCKSNGQSDCKGRKDRKPPSIDTIFKMMDTNEDGKLEEKEVKGPLKNDFSKIDLNEDGYLTREELEKAPKPDDRQGPPPSRH